MECMSNVTLLPGTFAQQIFRAISSNLKLVRKTESWHKIESLILVLPYRFSVFLRNKHNQCKLYDYIPCIVSVKHAQQPTYVTTAPLCAMMRMPDQKIATVGRPFRLWCLHLAQVMTLSRWNSVEEICCGTSLKFACAKLQNEQKRDP